MLKHNNIKYKTNNRMSNVIKIIQVGLLLHIMVDILKNHDHFDLRFGQHGVFTVPAGAYHH